MTDILALLQCLDPCVSTTTLRRMSVIITAIITMTGRVTMLGISRWAGQGGSYRTIQRFFQTVIPWPLVFWLFFREHNLDQNETYFLAGDECVVSKSGKQTHGLDRFFSSLYSKPIPGVSFFSLSLVGTKERRSYPMMVEQVIRTEEEKAAAKAKKQARKAKAKTQKGKRGRPKGSKNKDKTQVALTPELERIKAMVMKQLAIMNGEIPIQHLVLDGHFGNNNALQMTRQSGLHLISKLRHDAALYFQYVGPQKRRKYGGKVHYANIPTEYLRESKIVDGILTQTYQAIVLHKGFVQPLNAVIIVKTNLKTGKQAQVILFSSDLDLAYDQIIDMYSLRFQIEFNFRDAKQYWGLEDFMNVSETAVTNAANLSLFMVNLTQPLLRDLRQESPEAGILDLKTYYRGHKYVTETLKLLPEKPEPIFIQRIFATIAQIGRIHGDETRPKAA